MNQANRQAAQRRDYHRETPIGEDASFVPDGASDPSEQASARDWRCGCASVGALIPFRVPPICAGGAYVVGACRIFEFPNPNPNLFFSKEPTMKRAEVFPNNYHLVDADVPGDVAGTKLQIIWIAIPGPPRAKPGA